MAGDVTVAVVSGRLSSLNGGSADFTETGFGTPEGCIVLATRDEADDTSVSINSKASIGFSDFTNHRCITHQDEDNSAKVDCDALKSNTKVYVLLNSTGGVDFSGTASTITDGVRLTHTSGEGNDPFVTVIMFGGADQAIDLRSTGVNSSQDGTATITHAGLTDGNDKLIFFIGVDISGEDSISSGVNNSFGVCHITGNDAGGYTFTQRCMGWASDHNNTVGSPFSIISTDRVLDIITEAGTQDWGLEVTAFSSSGNTITVTTRDNGSGAGMEVYSLIVDLDDRKAKVGSVDSPTSGISWTPSVALGFTPQYVGLGINLLLNENSILTSAAAGIMGISSNTGAGEETCHSWYNEDAVGTTNTNNEFRSKVIKLRTGAGTTVQHEQSHTSFNSGDWTYAIDTVVAGARKWFYWAIEEVAVAAPPSGVGTQILPKLTQQGTVVMLPEGAGAQDLPLLTQQGTGDMDFEGVGVQALPPLTQQGTGDMDFEGAGDQALPPLTQQGTGDQVEPEGAGAQDLPLLTQQGTGDQVQPGDGVQDLPPLTQQGTVVMLPEGDGAQALPSFTQLGDGTHTQAADGAGIQVFSPLTQQGTGDMDFEGAGVQGLPPLTQQGTGDQGQPGAGVQGLPPLTQQGTGDQGQPGVGVQDLPPLTQQGTVVQLPEGTGGQGLSPLTQQGTGDQGQPGLGTQDLPFLTQQGDVVQLPEGDGVQDLPPLTQQGTGAAGEPEGAGTQDLPPLTQQGTAVLLPEGTSDQDLPPLTQQGVGDMDFEGVGAQALPALIQLGSGTLVGAVVGGVFKPIYRPRRRPGQGKGK